MNAQDFSRYKTLVIFCCITIFCASIALFIIPGGPEKKSTSTEKSWPVTARAVSVTSLAPRLTLYGQISSLHEAQLRARTDADVLGVLVKPGDIVAAGHQLIRLDEQQLSLKLAEKNAAVTELNATIALERKQYQAAKLTLAQEKRLYQLSQREFKRYEQLFAQKFAAQARLDEAKKRLAQQQISLTAQQLQVNNHPLKLKQLTAQLQRAKAEAKLISIDLQRSQLPAPFPARVTRIHVSPGERVKTGDLLADLYDLSQLEIKTQIPERYLPLMQKALMNETPLYASALLGDKTVRFQFNRFAGQIESGQGALEAIFVLDELDINSSQTLLILGKTLSLQLELPTISRAIGVPWSAVYGMDRIYKIHKNRLVSTPISLHGETTDAQQQRLAIIRSPELKNGDVVLTTQLPNAIHGLKVDIQSKLSSLE